MSQGDPFGDERRQFSPKSGPEEDVIDAVVYYGLWQVLLLSSVMLWFVYLSPVGRGSVVGGSIVVLIGLPVIIGLRRLGIVGDPTTWPRVESITLGTAEGYRAVLARGVFLSSVVGLGAYGSAAVGRAVGSTSILLIAVVALAIVLGCVAVFPAISGVDRRSRIGRNTLYALALLGAVYFGAPFDSSVGFSEAVVLYPLLVGFGLVDCCLGSKRAIQSTNRP